MSICLYLHSLRFVESCSAPRKLLIWPSALPLCGCGALGYSHSTVPTPPRRRGTRSGLADAKGKAADGLLASLEGLQSKEIAVQLGTTCQVIKNRIVLIYDKLCVRNRYDLLKYLLETPPTRESVSTEPRGREM